jgi:biopolymer transport protein ExbD
MGMLGGFSSNDELPFNADVNVTSLVDVAFVLLIIFMIAAPIMQGGVDVDLPKAAAKPLNAKQGIVVSLDRQGKIFLDETPVSYRDFRATFRSIVATRKPDAVYLRADNRASYGDVVRVVAIIRNSGVRNLGLVAEDEESK